MKPQINLDRMGSERVLILAVFGHRLAQESLNSTLMRRRKHLVLHGSLYCLLLLFLDADECGTNTHNCDANAHCTNSQGSFTCACNSGYNGDGTSCPGNQAFRVNIILYFYEPYNSMNCYAYERPCHKIIRVCHANLSFETMHYV